VTKTLVGTPDNEPTPHLDALVDLCRKCGAAALELGYLHDDVPVEEAGWWASVQYAGTRITVDDHTSPEAACEALAKKVLNGGMCRCGRTAVTDNRPPRRGGRLCRWRLLDGVWAAGCDAPSIKVGGGKRGDLKAIQAAFTQHVQGGGA
jgi:hypothetical protein